MNCGGWADDGDDDDGYDGEAATQEAKAREVEMMRTAVTGAVQGATTSGNHTLEERLHSATVGAAQGAAVGAAQHAAAAVQNAAVAKAHNAAQGAAKLRSDVAKGAVTKLNYATKLTAQLTAALGRAPKPRVAPSAADPSALAGAKLKSEDVRALLSFGSLAAWSPSYLAICPQPHLRPLTRTIRYVLLQDVLHLRHLPELGGALRPADVEVLLQVLLVPYLRVPLLLRFFAEPTRTAALAHRELQRVRNARLFPASIPHLVPIAVCLTRTSGIGPRTRHL